MHDLRLGRRAFSTNFATKWGVWGQLQDSVNLQAPSILCVLHALQNATESHSAEHATHTGDTKERELLKCVVAVNECIRGGGRHVQDVICKQ